MVYAFGEYEFLLCYKCKHCLESLPCNLALKNLASKPYFAFFLKKWAILGLFCLFNTVDSKQINVR